MKNRTGFGPRLGAYLLDIVFAAGLTFILLKIIPSFFEGLINWDAMGDEDYEGMQMIFKGSTDTVLAFLTGSALVGFLYNIIEGFTGQTPGKMLLGLTIANQDGSKTSVEKLMARFALKNISSIFGLIGLAVTISALEITGQVLGFLILIGCFFVLGEAKLSFHDMIAKTAVFKKSELESKEE